MNKRGFLKVVFIVSLLFLAIPALSQNDQSGICTYDDCPASTQNPIAAAWATQAYYVMSDIVYQIGHTDLGLFAPLLYILSAFAGMIAMVLGAPPKNYLWFFLGPAIYGWLIFTPEESKGVAWEIAGYRQPQESVWEGAELGVVNSNLAIRNNLQFDKKTGPSQKIQVPYVFLWMDELFSAQVQALSQWTGVYSQRQNTAGNTNTLEPPEDSSGGSLNHAWVLLSNSKWPMLENITGAELHNGDLREAFITFMSSECGDIMANHIDESAYISAAHNKGSNMPDHIFPADAGGGGPKREALARSLKRMVIPVPYALNQAMKKSENTSTQENGSLKSFLNANMRNGQGESSGASFADGEGIPANGEWATIGCYEYHWLLVQGFRYETGHIFNQLIREATEHGVSAEQVIYDFLYGWDFGEKVENSLSTEQQEEFIKHLIFLHLFRNEMALAPSPVTLRYSRAGRTTDYAKAYQRNLGSKQKYGELFTWAKLMPYVQGAIMYLVIIAYPFMCMLMIVPGWHKAFFTWLGFLAWTKSWDLGFSIVMTLERSLWGLIHNSKDAEILNERVLELSGLSKLTLYCNGQLGLLGCDVPVVRSDTPKAVEGLSAALSTEPGQSWGASMEMWDQATLLAPNLDIDLANSFYIFLMSALYFGVPAVTGQIFLGARAGAASMVNSFTQVAGTAGNNAAMGFSGEMNALASNNSAMTGQTATAKSLRGSGAGGTLMAKAMDSQFAAAGFELDAAAMNHDSGQLSSMAGINQARSGSREGSINFAHAIASGGFAAAEKIDNAAVIDRRARNTALAQGAQSNPIASGTGDSGAQVDVMPESDVGGRKTAAHQTAQIFASAGKALASKWNSDAASAVDAGIKQRQARLGVSGFRASQYAKGANNMSGRYQQAAQHKAAEARFRAQRNYSQQVQGTAAALGVFTGALSAGPKSEDAMGMAGVGMLGTDNQARFNAFDAPFRQRTNQAANRMIGPSDPALQFHKASLVDGATMYAGADNSAGALGADAFKGARGEY